MTILTREQIQNIVDANWFGLHDLPEQLDLLALLVKKVSH